MRFFTADWHVDHPKAMNFPLRRGMVLEQWVEMLMFNTNSLLSPGDTLYMLGDFSFKNPATYRRRIKCKDIWLIKGNHDPSNEQCRLAFGKDRVVHTLETHCNKVPTFLSHYPHLHWPKSHRGSFHLYGHMHMQREAFWDKVPELTDRRCIDVCPENAKRLLGEYRPFSEMEIYDLLIKRKGHDPIEWYDELGKLDATV
jgi:calcineurin-like phosphoesterase family protein